MLKNKSFRVFTLGLLLITESCFSGCSTTNTNLNYLVETNIQKVNKDTIIESYSNLVYATYSDSLDAVKNLQEEVNKFVFAPSKEGLESVKSAWLKARIPYGQSEAFKFYDGPIDSLDSRINASPVDEAFIDYVYGNQNSGVINNPNLYSEINKNTLSELNKKNTVLGFHVIEFLLWGQDLTDGPETGQRKYTDFLTDGNGTSLNQSRRGNFLITSTNILVDDMQKLVEEWSPNKVDNYRFSLKQKDPDEFISNIIKGMAILASKELAFEHMNIPLNVQESEEDVSSFSDSTQSDLVQNTKSIENVFMGTYTTINGNLIKGTSIYQLIQQNNPEFALKLKGQISSSCDLVSKIKNPFDQEIKSNNKEGNLRVKNAANSIESLGESIYRVGAELGLKVKIME